MSNGVNLVILVGRLGADPELRATSTGTPVCNANLATKYKSANHENTSWHRLVIWGKQAEILNQYCKKGSQIFIEGRIDYREFEKDGAKQVRTEIIVHNFQMLGSKRPENIGNTAPADYEKKQVGKDFDDIPF